jgi:prepilin-type N-terminal cleavage/methylation domain-containing protein
MKKLNYKGFTLIELLMFMAIFSTLLVILSSIFGSILDVQLEGKSYSSVDLDSRYVLAKLAYDFQSADSANTINNDIILPATASAGPILKIKINSTNYTYSASSSGRLQLANPTLADLTSSDSSVSALLFRRIGPGGNKDTIQVSFRLTSNVQRRGSSVYKDFQSTFSMP